MVTDYRFTRRADGAYVVTTPTADGADWRQLDGYVSTHAGGTVVCCALFGRDALLTADVQAAFVTWWGQEYGQL